MSSKQIPGKVNYPFRAEVWLYSGNAGWYFVSLPESLAMEIRRHFGSEEAAFGRLAVKALIGNSTWDTAIWYDVKKATYLLPIKATIRKTESISAGAAIDVIVGI
jgi:hypothetical protein